ncbi:Abortive infection protein [Crinalium epipsammum PCC 9333]|uniref:Abortive infection protein n=1 Tax=Crinalium epipsammum PCC 9333 TaxID=1173022 RepID=K9VY83_9CYAN|nr:CPBP family intramembrane glutamic endopeptidase [Crinalium epipsammum]AFZ13063.1 Abortive infection protein [Crinalium epipsammum PCC 9333]
MTIKRLILIVLTLVAVVKISLSLIESWGQPQIQSRLELYQTNLLLHASEWQGGRNSGDFIPAGGEGNTNLKALQSSLVGNEPLKVATKQYTEAVDLASSSLNKAQKQLQQVQSQPVIPSDAPKEKLPYPPIEEASSTKQQLQGSINQLESLRDELDLRLGIIQTKQKETDAAVKTWNDLIARHSGKSEMSSVKTAQVLVGLWSIPPRLVPNAEAQIQKDLDSWFRYQGLIKLYNVQQRQDDLVKLQAQEQQVAQQAIVKLAIIGGIPVISCLIGTGLVIFLVVQLLIKGKRSLIAQNDNLTWETPWNGEIVWQVFIVGFFFIGQILLPLVFGLFFGLSKINPASFDSRAKAFYVLLSYLLMSAGGVTVLYLSIKKFLPLPKDWFRFDWRGGWILWGFGGYFVALPLVILVSLVNQKLWQGQGGSNPILPIALENRDGIALTIFFTTAAIAAPLFEEFLFRGFLLPSLTRYFPAWGAIILSSFLFAIAHLSLSEVLPLMTLGIILGVVYTRSRNLLSSILLHSLWNSGTLLSLFILGSGGS